jgi:hypothetical protein
MYIQSTSVIRDFGNNKSFFHSPAVSLCFVIVTTSVTPVSYISDLRSHQISPTFPNSWFFRLYRFWQSNGNFIKVPVCSSAGCSLYMKSMYVTWYYFVSEDAVETCKLYSFFGFAKKKVKPLTVIMDRPGQSVSVIQAAGRNYCNCHTRAPLWHLGQSAVS